MSLTYFPETDEKDLCGHPLGESRRPCVKDEGHEDGHDDGDPFTPQEWEAILGDTDA